MPYTPDGKTLMLDALRGGNPAANRGAGMLALHAGAPGDTGINELVGGGYGRQAITIGAANAESPGNLDITNQPTFNITGPVTIDYCSVWSTEGTPKILGWKPLPPQFFPGVATYQMLDGDMHLNLEV